MVTRFLLTSENIAIILEGVSRVSIDHEVDEKDEGSSIRGDLYWLRIDSRQGYPKYVIDAGPQDLMILRKALGDKVQGECRSKAIRPPF